MDKLLNFIARCALYIFVFSTASTIAMLTVEACMGTNQYDNVPLLFFVGGFLFSVVMYIGIPWVNNVMRTKTK